MANPEIQHVNSEKSTPTPEKVWEALGRWGRDCHAITGDKNEPDVVVRPIGAIAAGHSKQHRLAVGNFRVSKAFLVRTNLIKPSNVTFCINWLHVSASCVRVVSVKFSRQRIVTEAGVHLLTSYSCWKELIL